MKARTLKNLRKDAAPEDRGSEALTPTPAPADWFRPAHTRYVPVSLRPTTLDQLQIACGSYGDAAVQDARWGATLLWLMRLPPRRDKLSNPPEVTSRAVFLCRENERVAAAYPSLSGKPFPNLMAELSDADQSTLRAVASDTMGDWERDGSPGLGGAIEREFQYINAVRNAELECQPTSPDA